MAGKGRIFVTHIRIQIIANPLEIGEGTMFDPELTRFGGQIPVCTDLVVWNWEDKPVHMS